MTQDTAQCINTIWLQIFVVEKFCNFHNYIMIITNFIYKNFLSHCYEYQYYIDMISLSLPSNWLVCSSTLILV